MLATKADKVFCIYIHHCGRGISVNSHRVGVNLIATRRYVTSGKYGIADGETFSIEFVPFIVSKCQRVQVFRGNIFTLLIRTVIDGDTFIGRDHTTCGDMYAAVFGTFAFKVVMSFFLAVGSVRNFTLAIHITDVTTAEYIAMAFAHRSNRTDFTAVNFHVGGTEYITIGVVNLTRHLVTGKVVAESASATEYIAFHLAAIHSHVGLAGHKLLRSIEDIFFILQFGGTNTDGSNFTTTIKAITDNTIVKIYESLHHYGTFTISGTIEVTIFLEQIIVRIFKVEQGHEISIYIFVTHITLIHIYRRSSTHLGHFAAAICAALDGGLSVDELCSVNLTYAYSRVAFRVALETAAEHIAHLAAINLTVCLDDLSAQLCRDGSIGGVNHTRHGTGITTAVDITHYATAKQLHVGLSAHVGQFTFAATIHILGNDSSRVDGNNGIVSFFVCPVGVTAGVGSIEVFNRRLHSIGTGFRAGVETIMIVDFSFCAATEYGRNLGAILQIDLGESRYGKLSQSCAIYRADISVHILHRSADGNVGVLGDAGRVVTAVNTQIYAGIVFVRGIDDVRYANVAGTPFIFSQTTAKQSIDFCGRAIRYVDVGYSRVTFGECAAVHIVHRTAVKVDGGGVCGTAVGTGTEDVHAFVFQVVMHVDDRSHDVVRSCGIGNRAGEYTVRTTENTSVVTFVSIYQGISNFRQVTTAIHAVSDGIFSVSTTQQHVGISNFYRVGKPLVTASATGHEGQCFFGILATDNVFYVGRL